MTHHRRTEASDAGLLGPRAARSLAEGLGWFSIGLGLVEILTPGRVTRALGMRGSEPLVQAYGAREMAAGIGILASGDPTPWLWGRVAGDGLDLATLSSGLKDHNRQKANVGLALAAVAGITLLDILAARSMAAERDRRHERRRQSRHGLLRAYRHRSGLPRAPGAMRGAASDFEIPRDFRTPDLLRRWT